MMNGNNSSQQASRADAYQLSDKDFKFFCEIVYDNTGIVLDERKREMIYRRLMRRNRQLNLGSFAEYCDYIRNNVDEELPNLVNAITTNLTSFFRENHHFDYLREVFLPEHIRRAGTNRRLRVWSSACSTGEEPYSLAITLYEALGAAMPNWDARILATDLDSDVLAKGATGTYSIDRVEGISIERKREWFSRIGGRDGDTVQVNPDLQELITFNQLNLLHEWPMQGPFDVILCRNVLIYFDKKTKDELINRFYKMLRPGGLLMLGHSESIAKESTSFEFLGKTTFRKPLVN